MTQAKHTPGPWLFDEAGYVTDKNDNMLAECEHPDMPARANARLIAAAPDLLKALEAALDAGYLDYGYAPTLNAARAAIAKARGDI